MLRGRLGRRFCEKKPKPPYVFRHPSQGNRRGDARPASKNRRNHSAVESSREKTEGEGAIPLGWASSSRKVLRRFGSLPLVGNGPCGSIASCSLVPVGVPQEEVVSGGIGPQRAPPSRRFGATDYKAAAEFDTGRAGTAQTGSWVRRRKGEFRGSRRHTVTAAVGLRCCYLNLRHASMREQQRL
jgi:hypothetical protein